MGTHQVQSGYDRNVFVLAGSLYESLSRIREHTARNTEQDLAANQSSLVCSSTAASEAKQNTESAHEEACTEDDEPLYSPEVSDQKTKSASRHCRVRIDQSFLHSLIGAEQDAQTEEKE